MAKPKIDYSLVTLATLSTQLLTEIVSDRTGKYTFNSIKLANRVLNSRY